MKLLAVTPLTCRAAPTLTEAPVVVKVATRAVRLVPAGTVRAIVWAASLTVPTTGGARPWKLKAVMALAALGVGPGPAATVTVTR